MQKSPFVSILINNYNYGKYIQESIDSALSQTYKNKEVIVVDDGSVDNSFDIIDSYSDDKIVKIFKPNSGQASAFNAGFLASSGDIICFLDSDDFFYQEKVESLIHIFEENPEIGWIFHSLDYVDRTGNRLSENNEKTQPFNREFVDFREVFRKGKRFTRSIPCGLCFRRKTLEKILPMPESSGVTISDNYIKYAALVIAPGLLIDDNLAAQRIHDSNIYTFRSDSQMLRAEINIKTGFYLRKKFPQTSKISNRIFLRGCGELLSEGNISKLKNILEYQEYINTYTTVQLLIDTLFRLPWYILKNQLENIYKK